MSKRTYQSDIVNKRPMKLTTQQKQTAMNRFGFIQGGRFLRSQPVQQRYGTSARVMKTNEVKGVDGAVDVVSIIQTTGTNANIFVINAVQQGSGSWNRVGRKIRMKSLRIKALLEFSNVTNPIVGQNTVRMVVVYDKQPSSGVVPNFDTIFGGTDQTGTEATTFLSNLRYDNTERFSVLKDEVITSSFKFVNAAGTVTDQYELDCFIKLKGLVTVFSGQSNPMTIADISTGAIYVAFRAEQNSVTQIASIQNSVYRLRYYDN